MSASQSPEKAFPSIDELIECLDAEAYLADRGLATAIYLAMSLKQPLLLEGEAGVGKTEVGKALAAGMMVLGYCMIIVPTGIVSAELAHVAARGVTTQVCEECMAEGHDADAIHCKYCGTRLY